MGGLKLILFLFGAIIIFKAVITYMNNKNLPIGSIKAKLINKKRDIYTHVHVNGVITNDEILNLNFELDTGTQITFIVGESIFRGIPEYERGTLTYLGKRFLRFESDSGCLEK